MANGKGLGKVALYSIIFFSASLSLFQLGIGKQIVAAVFIIAFGATALAVWPWPLDWAEETRLLNT